MEKFFETNEDGCLFIGHASALVRIKGKLILCDPVWGNYKPYGEAWEFDPPQINLDHILDKVDACIVSHIHADHVCPEILKKLKCPVYIMSGRPELEKRLLDFCKVRVVKKDTTFGIAFFKLKDLEHYVINIRFIPNPHNSIDSSCFIYSDDYCVYHGNDNFLSYVQMDVLGAWNVAQRIDVAMLPYAFIHFYPFLMDGLTLEQRENEIQRLNKQHLDLAQYFTDKLNPRAVLLCGNNLVHAYNDFINSNRLNYSFAPGTYALKGHPLAVAKPGSKSIDIKAVQERVSKSTFRVPNHSIVVNGTVLIDTDDGHVGYAFGVWPEAPKHEFWLGKKTFEKWISGEWTFEQVLGSRDFRYSRTPNVYNQQVMEFLQRCL